jgi:hypothetical protein
LEGLFSLLGAAVCGRLFFGGGCGLQPPFYFGACIFSAAAVEAAFCFCWGPRLRRRFVWGRDFLRRRFYLFEAAICGRLFLLGAAIFCGGLFVLLEAAICGGLLLFIGRPGRNF